MSTPVLILGESGSGKSFSMRHMPASDALLVQVTRKNLPFKSDWSYWSETNKAGNIFVTDNADQVIAIMKGTKRKRIIVDDYQYILSNELLRRWNIKGYDKFSEVGYNGLNVLREAAGLADDVQVFFFAHTMLDDDGILKIKTPGKLMATYSVEGLFSLVLRAVVRDGTHFFSTVNNSADTVKSPPGMFEDELIPNDLQLVSKAIVDFGWGASTGTVVTK